MRGYGYWNPGVGHGGFTITLLMILVMWGGLVALAFVVFFHHDGRFSYGHHPSSSTHGPTSQALGRLNERLARGDISLEEYFAALDALRRGRDHP